MINRVKIFVIKVFRWFLRLYNQYTNVKIDLSDELGDLSNDRIEPNKYTQQERNTLTSPYNSEIGGASENMKNANVLKDAVQPVVKTIVKDNKIYIDN